MLGLKTTPLIYKREVSRVRANKSLQKSASVHWTQSLRWHIDACTLFSLVDFRHQIVGCRANCCRCHVLTAAFLLSCCSLAAVSTSEQEGREEAVQGISKMLPKQSVLLSYFQKKKKKLCCCCVYLFKYQLAYACHLLVDWRRRTPTCQAVTTRRGDCAAVRHQMFAYVRLPWRLT